jgi:aspartyl-tRNA(Asn)/glutamyl-tRNA(Gln) amidotransferase subunit C
MSLTPDEVRHIGTLARLGLSDDDVSHFGEQLSAILGYFEQLRAVDTEGVPPTAHTLPIQNVMREDEPEPSLTPEAILANAPLAEQGKFRVRAILDE